MYLVVSFLHPHPPLDPPPPYETRYDPGESILPSEGFEVNEALPWSFLEPLTVQTGPFRPGRVTSPRELGRQLALTRGLVSQIDDSLGRILELLDLDRSVVCFTSDHGDFGGHRGMFRKVPWIPFEDLWRVPLVVAAPDAAPGTQRDEPVQNMDWVLTALDYAGVPYDPSCFDGRDLRPALTDPSRALDRDRTLLAGVADGWPTVRRGRHKLITRAHFTLPGHALFDLEADPGETVDLAADPAHADLVADLTDLLHRSVWVAPPDLPTRQPVRR
jgi:choline-sulfatase